MREIQPGIILGSCQPIVLMSARAEDGGSPLKPGAASRAGTNADQRFIHSSRWPRGGQDRFMLAGGETNASPQCDDTVGAFMVWDASDVLKRRRRLRRWARSSSCSTRSARPTARTSTATRPSTGWAARCTGSRSTRRFHNGGVVALARVRERHAHPADHAAGQDRRARTTSCRSAGSTSAPHWNPNGKVIYIVDYTRGVDVLRYTGPTYVPAGGNEPTLTDDGLRRGGRLQVGARRARPARGLRFSPSLREKRSYTVEVFQQSRGRDGRARTGWWRSSRGKKGSFSWNGRAQGRPARATATTTCGSR